MGSINLIAGTASGKIGVNQYQTHGLTCVVRTKQPEGLTNEQALLINKPVLDALSLKYKAYASYILDNYPSDWVKPMARWNYYTKCNALFFDSGVTAKTGLCLSRMLVPPDCTAYYLYTESTESAVAYLMPDVLAAFGGQKAVFVQGASPKTIGECIFTERSVEELVTGLPYAAEYNQAGAVRMFFLSGSTGKIMYGCITLNPIAYPPSDFVGSVWYTSHLLPFGNFVMDGNNLVISGSRGQFVGNRLIIS